MVGGSLDLAVGLARAEPVVVHLLAPPASVDAARRQIAAAGLHGRVTVSANEGGVLLQTRDSLLVALDAQTGKRLWAGELTAESTVEDARRGQTQRVRHEWHHPMILDGRVYAVEGEPAPSWSYTHWPMGVVRVVHCFALKTGRVQRTWRWPKSLGEPAAAYNMTPVGDWLGLMLRTQPSAKSALAMLFVSRDGLPRRPGQPRHAAAPPGCAGARPVRKPRGVGKRGFVLEFGHRRLLRPYFHGHDRQSGRCTGYTDGVRRVRSPLANGCGNESHFLRFRRMFRTVGRVVFAVHLESGRHVSLSNDLSYLSSGQSAPA